MVHDAQRLDALAATQLLDAAREETFDRLTRLASRMLRVPCSVMSLIDEDRQFFLSESGMREDLAAARETPLSHSFCKHVVDRAAPLVVADARQDALVADNLAVRDLDVIAYCGVPLQLSDGHVLGAFCAIEPDPRDWSAGDVELLADLAALAVEAIELREARLRGVLAPPRFAREPSPERDPRGDALAAALPGAIAREEIALRYEPLVHLDSGEPWGFSVRPRWAAPGGHGPVEHDELHALAHRDGAVVALGEQVLDRACRDLAAWRAGAGDPPLGLALAIGAPQLGAPSFADRLASTLAVHGIPPRSVILTFDEPALLGARDAHRSTLDDLRELGVAIGLDGGGTGRASLPELAALPLDVVLLDPLLAAPEQARLAGAALATAQALALGAIGGGIADAQDAARLAALGCVTGQGPHFGGPLDGHAVPAWLAAAARP